MEAQAFTVYFRGFPADYDDDALKEMFARCGEIKKFFINTHNRSYGMVEYFDIRSCDRAINELNKTPPLNLFVNMAKNQPNDKKNSPTIMTTPPRRKDNSFSSPSIKDNSAAMFYDEEIIYVDSNNKQVDILEDENGVIYVPLSRVTGIRRVVRKKPKFGDGAINLHNGEFGVIDDYRSKQDNDTMSQSSNRSDRVVKVNDNANITVERNFKNDHRRSVSRNSFDQQASRNRSKSRSAANYEQNQNQHYKRINHNSTPHHNRKFPNENRYSEPAQNGYNDRQSNDAAQIRRPRSQMSTYSPNKDNMHTNKEDEKCIETSGNPVSTSPKQEQQKVQNSVQPPRKIPINLKNMPKNIVKKSAFKNIELPKEQFTEIKVVHAISETVGWVHINANEESFITTVMAKLDSASQNAAVQEPELNVMCMAKFDEVWYRARVIAITPKVRVKFVDYGNECDVPDGDLLELESAFLRDMPAQAVCIRLADGAPYKMADDIIFRVKPLQVVENDIVLVQVENSLYAKQELGQENPEHSSTPLAEQSSSDGGVLSTIQKRLYSSVKEGYIGTMDRTINLPNNTFIASFIPHNLYDELIALTQMETVPHDSFKANVGDIVAAENEEGWTRALILNIKQGEYKVAFIDYGTISVVKEIRPVPEKVKFAPQFSCKCVVDAQYWEQVSKIDSFNYQIVSISVPDIRIKLSSDGQFLCETTVQPWSPLEPKSDAKPKTATPPKSPPTTETAATKTENNRILSELKLNNNDLVQLVCENKGNVFVRTKQANEVLKQINMKVKEYASKAPSLSGNPVIGQMVAAQFYDEWYRATIKSVENETALVIYVDYGNEEKVNISDLKLLSEELQYEPITLIKIKLNHFVNKPFSQNALQYLEQLAVNETVLKANFTDSVENGVTLLNKNRICITDKLLELTDGVSNSKPEIRPSLNSVQNRVKEVTDNVSNSKPKIRPSLNSVPNGVKEEESLPKPPGPNDPKITEMDIQVLPKGKAQVKLLSLVQLEVNMISICLNKADVFHALHVELGARITKYANTVAPQEPYAPEPEEYVIANNRDKWYRALCIGPEGDEYNLLFADYGFMSTVPASRIRRIPVEFTKPEAIANFACITDLPETPSQAIIDRLQTLLEINNVYDVDVLEKNEDLGAYVISMPTVVKKLKDEGLI